MRCVPLRKGGTHGGEELGAGVSEEAREGGKGGEEGAEEEWEEGAVPLLLGAGTGNPLF
jgi:hypothetical protein